MKHQIKSVAMGMVSAALLLLIYNKVPAVKKALGGM